MQKVPSQHGAFLPRLRINILLNMVFGRANHKTLIRSNGHQVWLLEPLSSSLHWLGLFCLINTSLSDSTLYCTQVAEVEGKRSHQPSSLWATGITPSELTNTDTVPFLLPPPLSPETRVNSSLAPHSHKGSPKPEVAQREVQAFVHKNRDNSTSPEPAIVWTCFPVSQS